MRYGIIAAVESTSVISFVMYDCCKHFTLVRGLGEKLWSPPRIEVDDSALGPLSLQYRGYS